VIEVAKDAGSFPGSPTLETRKPIDRLTADDLLVFPIWEFAIDEEEVEEMDETWVRPVDVKVVRKGMWSLSVAADFRTRSGLVIPGFVDVSTAEGTEVSDGVLLPQGKYVSIRVGSPSARVATARSLGMKTRDVFPLSYTLRVLIGREKRFRSGTFE
jgi:hypothetical protein